MTDSKFSNQIRSNALQGLQLLSHNDDYFGQIIESGFIDQVLGYFTDAQSDG
jgi:hypothetical protein